jgi:hypothetical protein
VVEPSDHLPGAFDGMTADERRSTAVKILYATVSCLPLSLPVDFVFSKGDVVTSKCDTCSCCHTDQVIWASMLKKGLISIIYFWRTYPVKLSYGQSIGGLEPHLRSVPVSGWDSILIGFAGGGAVLRDYQRSLDVWGHS